VEVWRGWVWCAGLKDGKQFNTRHLEELHTILYTSCELHSLKEVTKMVESETHFWRAWYCSEMGGYLLLWHTSCCLQQLLNAVKVI